MKILLVHNAYQQRGGEDAVVDAEQDLLRSRGHTVHRYQRHNDEIEGMGRVALARDTVWSPRSSRDLRDLLARVGPDVVHAHNTFPLVSPSIHWAAAQAGVPLVQTLHNFRLLCPQALLLRDGHVCEDCVGRVPWRAVRHRCYRGSAAQSAAVAAMLQVHRWLGTWRDKVTLYIALNAFCRDRFIAGGLPAERIRVKPNFVDLPRPDVQPRSGFLFVGRLAVEKGVDTLAEAAALLRGQARIAAAGSGPLQALLQASALQLLGPLQPAEVYRQMSGAAALVMPSIWYENFPRTLVEAFAHALPVIASRLGAMASLIDDGQTGLLFTPGSAQDLAAKLRWAQEHPEDMRRMGERARALYELRYAADSNHEQLMSIYAEAMARAGADPARAGP